MAEAPWRAQGPPPPPALSGNIPATRLKSEIGERRNEPPACVQNAMMTKDKKPFTYTPGGIDLSEIKSPRMARRIERNANAPGVGEIPQTPPTPQQSRPLPPSALAAMQPALPIQVFPTGAPPPPPPPPVNAPPPPPMQPLPTKPVATNDGVYERPDMTRIIPENPMALLRKTPKVERRTFLDELNDMERKNMQQAPMQQAPMQQAPMSPQAQPQYSPPARSQPPTPQFTPAQYTRQPSYTTPAQPYSPQPQAYAPQNAHPVPQMVSPQVVENNGPPSPPTKTSKVNIGSLYIPPINQQQQQPVQSQPSPKSQQSSAPPTPPQRQVQTPPTPQSPIPKLNAAPKPWQNQQRKEPELPEWAQRHQQSPPKEEQVQPVRMTGPPRVTPVQMQPPPARPGVEVVWVTQPEVYQHPGPTPPPGQRRVPPHITQQQQQQQQMQQQQMQQMQQQQMQRQQQSQQQYVQQEMKGTRIIPIQIEGQNSGPNTPATPERNFNRQQSWTPTQSNAFKVIQKMTNTDGMEDEADQQQVEYGPRTAQQFPNEQMRKMNLNDSDRDFMNRVKQGDMNNTNQPYVHPSQQTVEEPKKYMGSAIPSRAFRMVQAMTSNSPGPGQSDL